MFAKMEVTLMATEAVLDVTAASNFCMVADAVVGEVGWNVRRHSAQSAYM